MVGDVDLAVGVRFVALAIRKTALTTPGLERAFVLGLVRWLHVELLIRLQEPHARPKEANKWTECHHREKSRADAHKLAGELIYGHLPAIQRARNASQ